MEMTEQGRSLSEIQQFIDRKYLDLQENRTPTPLPPILGQLAELRFTEGPDMVKSEDARLNSLVYIDVRGRDIGSYVEEARELLDRELDLPAGYTLRWSGQFEAMQEANRRFRVVVPITIGILPASLPQLPERGGEPDRDGVAPLRARRERVAPLGAEVQSFGRGLDRNDRAGRRGGRDGGRYAPLPR